MQKSSKKILVLSHEFPPFGGGGGAVMEQLCSEMHQRGYELEVWTSNIPEKIRFHFPYRIRYFPSPRMFRFETNYLAIILFLLQTSIVGLLLRNRGSFLIFSNMTIPAGISGAIISRIRKIPHVTWHHGTEVHGNNMRKGAPWIYRVALKLIWKGTAVNFFVSESLLSRANSISKVPRGFILPVAVKVSNPVSHPRDCISKCFLFAGRLEPVKNAHLFIMAAYNIIKRKSCPDAVFRIVGSGSLYHEFQRDLERSGQKSIFLHQSVSRDELEKIYQDTYAFVLPSEVEGFPLTVLEAAHHAIPSIGADTDGIRDCIDNGKTGLLFGSGDYLALASKIEILYHDENLRNNLGVEARVFATRFTINNTADILISHIENITFRKNC